MFAVAVGDHLQKRIVPLACKAQEDNVGSWEMDKECHRVLGEIRYDQQLLRELRRWCFITCVLQAYLRSSDLHNLWVALTLSRFGHTFGRLSGNMLKFLLQQTFGGAQLGVELPGVLAGSSLNTLSPRCQCASMKTRPRAEARDAYLRDLRGQLGRTATADIFCWKQGQEGRTHPRHVKVPEWVAYSAYSKTELLAPQVVAVPRFARVQRENAPPLCLQGVSRFATMGQHRCVVPHTLMGSSKEVLEAMYECECFLERLAYYYEGYILGSLGVNKHMREMLENLRKCWDFEYLLHKVPREEHYHAFFHVYDKLFPTLRRTMWPAGQQFDFVQTNMPSKRGRNGMFEQYRELMRRVRVARKSRWLSDHWWRMKKVRVQSMMTYGKLSATLGRIFPWKFLSDVGRHCVFGLIGHMAGFLAPASGPGYCSQRLKDAEGELVLDAGVPGVSAGPPFEVRIDSLAAVGCGKTVRTARKDREEKLFRGRVGSFASLAFGSLRGKVVRVVGADFVLEESAIAASLLSDRFFSFPSAGTYCWHAVRVFLRSWMMRGPETSVERWGSLMHMLWDGTAGWNPHRVVSRLLIREAGLLGDEAVVHEIALALRDRHGLDPFTRGHADASEEAGVSAAPSKDLVVRRGLECGISQEALREQSCPSTLRDNMRAAIDKATREGRSGVLAALPLFVEDGRVVVKDRAASVRQDSLGEWRRSEEAAQWRVHRQALFPHRSSASSSGA